MARFPYVYGLINRNQGIGMSKSDLIWCNRWCISTRQLFDQNAELLFLGWISCAHIQVSWCLKQPHCLQLVCKSSSKDVWFDILIRELGIIGVSQWCYRTANPKSYQTHGRMIPTSCLPKVWAGMAILKWCSWSSRLRQQWQKPHQKHRQQLNQ